MESKVQKQPEAHHHELQILLPRSLDEYQTKFRDEHNEITKTMKDLSIIQHQAELEEKADNEQQLRKELSMVAQDNDSKHVDVNLRQEAYQEDDNLKLRNESIQEYKELHEQKSKQTSHLHWRFWIRSSSMNWIVWLRTHTEKHSVT